MRAGLLAAAALALVASSAFILADQAAAEREPVSVEIPTRVDDFRLVDHTGFAQSLRRLTDVKAIVLMTQVNGDADSRVAAKSLEALHQQHADVEFLMLNSSIADTRPEIAAEAAAQGYTIPVMDDDLQLAGEQLGVTYAGEVFVLEPRMLRVLYHGPAGEPLAAALADIEAGRPVANADVAGSGTSIAFPQRGQRAQHARISYAKDIAPVLEAKCVTCHQEGGIGPFAMSEYAIVKQFAPMIRESLRTDTMPPWHPDPLIGKFKHDASLTGDQVRMLVHWIEAGAPRGEGADPLAAVKHTAPEWPLGKPDLVMDIPSFALPPSGEIQYQYPTAANPLAEGRWVKAATLMPGDRRGVHHILAGYIPGVPLAGPASASQWEANYGEYAVGGESFQVPQGMGIFLPPGGHMGFQMHYTPYGKETVEKTRVGLYFYPEGSPPEIMRRSAVVLNAGIEIPPNTPRHEEVAYITFPENATLYSVFPHAHYRGESMAISLLKPGATSEELILSIPKYDFNWQRGYDFKQPIKIEPGTKLVTRYVYDNSKNNPANPDPTITVKWGEQSWEEMQYTALGFRWDDETVADRKNDYQTRLEESRTIGMMDKNVDGKVAKEEVRGRMAQMLLANWDKVDLDKDGFINASEMGPINQQMNGRIRAAQEQQSVGQ